MPAYYTVVQYVPDPIAGERMNLGIIVLSEGRIFSRFLRNWKRVTRFAQEDDIGYVREFARRVDRASLETAAGTSQPPIPGFPVPTQLDEPMLRAMASEWSNSIQFTPLQPSLEAPEMLLSSSVATFLREPNATSTGFRDRKDAVALAVRSVRRAVEHRVGLLASKQFVQTSYEIGGKVVPRLEVDLAITNARIHVASRALSFETHDMAELDRQARDAVYVLRDVGDFLGDAQIGRVRLAMVVLPPNSDMRGHRQAQQRFADTMLACQRINVEVVRERQAPEWAEGIAELVATEIVPHERLAARG